MIEMGNTDTSASARIRRLKAIAIRAGTGKLQDASTATAVIGVCCSPAQLTTVRATYTNTSGPCPGPPYDQGGPVVGYITLYFPIQISALTSVTTGQLDVTTLFINNTYPTNVLVSTPIGRQNCDPEDITTTTTIVTPEGTFTGTLTIPAGF